MSVRVAVGYRRVTLVIPQEDYERLQEHAARFKTAGYLLAQSVVLDQLEQYDRDQHSIRMNEWSQRPRERTESSDE